MLLLILSQLAEGRRRTRMVAGRRGSTTGIGKGLASMIKSLGEGEEEEELVSGDDIKADVKNYRLHNSMLSDGKSIMIIVLVSIVAVALILYCLFFKARNTETEFDYARMREMEAEREKSYKLIRTIAEHGIHPDRANGKIYKLRL